MRKFYILDLLFFFCVKSSFSRSYYQRSHLCVQFFISSWNFYIVNFSNFFILVSLCYWFEDSHKDKTLQPSFKYSKSRENRQPLFHQEIRFRSHSEQLPRYDSQREREIARRKLEHPPWGTRCEVSGRPDRASRTKPKFVRAASPPPTPPVSSPHLFVIIARDIILLKAI